jgi:hypothetical protein
MALPKTLLRFIKILEIATTVNLEEDLILRNVPLITCVLKCNKPEHRRDKY